MNALSIITNSRLNRFLLAGAFFLAILPGLAKETPKVPKQKENRFLFIVDIASAMRSCSNAIVKSVADLMDTDLQGELRDGDTMGLWTYNDRLHPEFPMQVWSPDDKTTIMDDMAAYLTGRHYEKRANLNIVMPALNQIIKHSQRLTIILMFDGVELIHGTPFDSDINELQKKYARELRAAHEPFVLVLVARDGVIDDYTINYPGEIAIPHTALPDKPVETNAVVAAAIPAPATVTNEPPPEPKIGPSIIITGSHKEVIPVTTPAPASVQVQVPAPVEPAPKAAPPPVVVAPPPARILAAPAPPPAVPVTPVHAAERMSAAPPPENPPTAPPVAPQPIPQPAVQAPAPTVPPVETVLKNPPPPPAQPVAQNVAMAAPSPWNGMQIAMLVMALALLIIAATLAVFLLRRSRHTPQPSLISQSIDKPR